MASTEGDPSSESDFWEQRYRGGTAEWDLGEAAPPLVDLIEGRLQGSRHLPSLSDRVKVFVPGCGYGYDALLWAKRGARVVALDLAPSAVKELERTAASSGLSPDRLRVLEGDFFAFSRQVETLPDHEKWDVIFEHTFLCALPPERRREYARTVANSLKRGGVLAAIFFAHGRPGGPPHSISEAEIRALFPSALRLLSLEPAPRTIPERAGAELVGLFRRD